VIFVTVGAQMPFDRLIRAVDEWAAVRNRKDVLAQIGRTNLRPKMISAVPFVDPKEFRDRVSEASIVVAHAGMGSIITALELRKPIIVMPRRGSLMETRNDHQVATAKHLQDLGRVAVAFDERELVLKLDDPVCDHHGKIDLHASSQLINALRAFLAQPIKTGR